MEPGVLLEADDIVVPFRSTLPTRDFPGQCRDGSVSVVPSSSRTLSTTLGSPGSGTVL